MTVVERNLTNFSRLWHPYMSTILLKGRHQNDIYYTMKSFDGPTLKDYFSKNKIESTSQFYHFHSKFLEILYYLNQENASCSNLSLKDFILVNDAPFLINLDVFHGAEQFLKGSEFTGITNFLKNNGGVYIETHSLDMKENLKSIAGMMYQTIGWGEIEDAIRIKTREEAPAQKKKKQQEPPKYVPLVPGIDPKIENILIKTWVSDDKGGYTGMKSVIQDLQELCVKTDEEEEREAPSEVEEIKLESLLEEVEEPRIDIPSETKSYGPPASEIVREPEDLSLSIPAPAEIAKIRATRPGGRGVFEIVRKLLFVVTLLACLAVAGYSIFLLAKQFMGKRNQAPIAKATIESSFIPERSKITLNGTSSTDPDDSDTLSYYWEVIEGDADSVNIGANRSQSAGQTYAIFNLKGTYKLQLKVFDGTTFSKPTSVIITVY
jgi:hypothetical protein